MSRGRLLLLPKNSPIAPSLEAASHSQTVTWLDHAADIMKMAGVSTDILQYVALAKMATNSAHDIKMAARSWKRNVVRPALQRNEDNWFRENLSLASSDVGTPTRSLPGRRQLSHELRFCEWGPTMWKFFKAWLLSRMHLKLPTEVWGLPSHEVWPCCPFCSQKLVDFKHIVEQCCHTAEHRARSSAPSTVLLWCLEEATTTNALRPRVTFLGLITASFVQALK